MASAEEASSLRLSLGVLQQDMEVVRNSVLELRSSLGQEAEDRQREDANLLQAVEGLIKSLFQETGDTLGRFEEVQEMVNVIRKSVDVVQKDVARTSEGSSEFISALNLLKCSLDVESAQQVELKNDYHMFIAEARGKFEEIVGESLKQQSSDGELMRVVNVLKDAVDQEVQHRISHEAQTDKAILEAATDRLRLFNLVKHGELVQCIEGCKSLQTQGEESTETLLFAPASQVNSVPLTDQDELLQTVDKTLQDVGLVKRASPENDQDELLAPIDSLELLQPVEDSLELMKKALVEIDQERKERTAGYGLLHSHMANFQYDFAVERNERTQIHGDLSALKAEVSLQLRDFKEGVVLMSQELRANTMRLENMPDSAQSRPAVSSSAPFVDASSIQDSVREEIVRVFGQHQVRHKELTDLIDSVATQEKAERSDEICKMKESLQQLDRRVEILVLSFPGEPCSDQLKPPIGHDRVLNQEVVETDDSIPREEFEGHVARLWEAIMHLQSLQLQDIQRKTRGDAFNNGLAMMSKAPSSTITPRTSAQSSPSKVSLGRSLLGKPVQPQLLSRSASPSGSSSRYTAPFLSDALVPVQATVVDRYRGKII